MAQHANLSSRLEKLIDHTMLRANASEEDIRKLCAEAREYNFYSVCVNPRWIPFCKGELSTSETLPITVVGFPLGANDVLIKQKEATLAIEQGAREIDMVIDIASALSHEWKKVEDEIKAVSKACDKIPLKVIIETAYLTQEEIREVSKCCLFGGADFVKTSTGFAPNGAKEEDIRTIRSVIQPGMGIKASGGIKTLADVERMIQAGATRIGASASVSIMEEWKKNERRL